MSAMRLRAGLWLALAVALTVIGTLQWWSATRPPLQSNLLALLPLTERSALAEEAVTRLTQTAGNRAVFLIGEESLDHAAVSARAFAADLRASAVFGAVVSDLPAPDPTQLTALYLRHRYGLLAEPDRTALASGSMDLEARLKQKLYQPVRFAFTLPLAQDPLGLTDAWLASLPLKGLRLESDNGLLVTRAAGQTWVLVTAELTDSAYDSTLQQAVDTAVARAESHLHQSAPQARVLRTGTVFYAQAARHSAEREFDLIAAGSLLGMMALLYLVFRSTRPLALGLLCVAFGIGAASVVTLAVYGQMHLITLVFGASLIGEAVDYAVQYFAAHLGAGQDWEPMAGLRRIAPGLTLALATSLLGYATLLLAPFPALAQIALFALAGLFAAWLSVFLLLPALLTRPTGRDPQAAVALPQRLLIWWKVHMSRRICLMLAGGLLVLAAPGWWVLKANDDIHLLIARSPSLVAQEEQIRELTGLGNSSQFFLIEGVSEDAVLARQERLGLRLRTLLAQGEITGYQSLSDFVPALAQQALARRLWQEHVFSDEAALKRLFARNGLRDDIATRSIADFQASDSAPLTLQQWLQTPMARPFAHLWLGAQEHGFAAMVLPQGTRDVARLAQAAAGLEGVILVDKAGSVSRLFRDYRQWGLVWLMGALCLVYGVLCLRYGWAQAAVTLAPTLLAMALALGLFGYLAIPLNLFNLMALMLVLGVGVNYAIFLREGGVRAAATLAGVLLSAGTTLLSFGLLAFSSMPALSSFGLTLLVGVGLAVLLAPMVLSFSGEPDA